MQARYESPWHMFMQNSQTKYSLTCTSQLYTQNCHGTLYHMHWSHSGHTYSHRRWCAAHRQRTQGKEVYTFLEEISSHLWLIHILDERTQCVNQWSVCTHMHVCTSACTHMTMDITGLQPIYTRTIHSDTLCFMMLPESLVSVQKTQD